MFSTELTPTPARESAMKTSASAKLRIWLKRMYDAAVHDVADDDGAFVAVEGQAPAEPVGERAAAEQADSGAAPDHADARRVRG